jgi:hypothetical protein
LTSFAVFDTRQPVIGPRLTLLVSDGYAKRAVTAYARSLGVSELGAEERALARELEAAFEAMYLMAAADGDVAPDELMLLSASLQAMVDSVADGELGRAEASLPVFKLNQALERFALELERDGLDTRLAAVASALASPDARRLAFRLAAGVAFVDDFVAHSEAEALDALGESMGLSKDDALELLREVHAALD